MGKRINSTAVLALTFCLIAGLAGGANLTNKKPVDYVDPMLGTSNSRWMLYPGPSMPFGMVKLSPDNQRKGWKAGYE